MAKAHSQGQGVPLAAACPAAAAVVTHSCISSEALAPAALELPYPGSDHVSGNRSMCMFAQGPLLVAACVPA